MGDGGVTDREFGQLEQRVKDLPDQKDLDAVRSEAIAAMNAGFVRLERLLEKHEAKTEKSIEDTATKTVESAFKLQWAEIEKYLKDNSPPRRDWLPYIVAGGVVLLAGLREAAPVVWRLMTAGA